MKPKAHIMNHQNDNMTQSPANMAFHQENMKQKENNMKHKEVKKLLQHKNMKKEEVNMPLLYSKITILPSWRAFLTRVIDPDDVRL